MMNFNDFKKLLESGQPFGHQDRQDTWGIVHNLGPVLKARIKKLVIELASELAGDRPFPRHQLDAAVRQVLLDLADGREPVVEARCIPESVDSEASIAKRDALLAELRAKFPGAFLKTSEEFSASRVGGVWITGKKMADYYGKDNSGFDYWVNPKLQRTLAKHNFYLEPYDPETWFAWPI